MCSFKCTRTRVPFLNFFDSTRPFSIFFYFSIPPFRNSFHRGLFTAVPPRDGAKRCLTRFFTAAARPPHKVRAIYDTQILCISINNKHIFIYIYPYVRVAPDD